MELSKRGKIFIGIFCSILYGFFFQLGDMFIKYTYNHSEIQVFEALFLRYIISLVIISSNMLVEKVSPLDSFLNVRNLIAAGILRLSAVVALNSAIQRTDLGTNAVVIGGQPMLSIVLAWLFLGEKMKCSEIVLGLFSYVGVAMVVWSRIKTPKNHPKSYALGIAFGFLAITLYSFYYILTRRIAQTNSLRRSIFYTSLVGVVLLPFSPWVFQTEFQLLKSPELYCYLLLTGGVVYFLALLTEVQSLRYLNVGLIMLLRNTEFLWAYSYDMIVLKVFPTFLIILGIFIVILTTSMITYNAAYDVKYVESMKRIWTKLGLRSIIADENRSNTI